MTIRDTNIVDPEKQDVDLQALSWDKRGNFWYSAFAHEIGPEDMRQHALTLEAQVRTLVKALREEYLITPGNYTICVRCGTGWAIGSPHEHHNDNCPLYGFDKGS